MLRPLYCVWLPSVQPWLSAPSRSCESPARTPAPTLAVAWTRVLWDPARVGVPKPAVRPLPPRDGICWQVRQLYRDAGVPGRFLLPGEAGAAGMGAGLGGRS